MYGQQPVQQLPPPQPYYRSPAPPTPQAPPQNVPPQVKDLGIDSTHQVRCAPRYLQTRNTRYRLIGFNIANVVPGSPTDA